MQLAIAGCNLISVVAIRCVGAIVVCCTQMYQSFKAGDFCVRHRLAGGCVDVIEM